MTYILKDSQTSDTDFWNNLLGREYLGGSFTASSNYTLHRVELKLNQTAGPVGNCICQIYSDSAGLPNTVLATATNSVSAAALPTTADFTPTFGFAGLSLTSATKYHIVIHGDASNGGYGADFSGVQWRSTSSGETSGQDVTQDTNGVAPFSVTSANAQGDFKTYFDDAAGGSDFRLAWVTG